MPGRDFMAFNRAQVRRETTIDVTSWFFLLILLHALLNYIILCAVSIE
jgi:hypothetical protein